jgi:hypothetical protein
MDLQGRSVALYGRFTPGVRDRLTAAIDARGGGVLRDLTGRSHVFVVGALAIPLIESGALSARLAAARARGVPILGERRFEAMLVGDAGDAPTAPLATVLGPAGLTLEDADVLAAFDLIVVEGEACRFGDAPVIRTGAELSGQGRSLTDIVRILKRAEQAPRGRRKVVLTPHGAAALQWDEGLTTLDGQVMLPLADEGHASLDDLFEAASLAEAHGELDEAARLYDQCARADRTDPIAPYNLGNIRLAQAAHEAAALAYRQALARDAGFVEARYNLAQALEAAGKAEAARAELERVIAADPSHADALFNLAQLRLQARDGPAAKALFQRYLALDPPAEWATIARKAIALCEAGGG